ncbi:iron-enterobactin transporter ATP-binding protein, partial [Staphylococcus pseudintermedius]
LSGGQRQRGWTAVSVAPKTDIILHDDPTTYLGITHQLKILELVQELNTKHGTTIMMVLHDINQAIRSSDHLIAMKDGAIIKQGVTHEVLTNEILESVFN